MIFGQTHYGWSTIANSFFSVYELNFGLYDTHALYLYEEEESSVGFSGWITSIYLYTSLTTLTLIFVNLFLAIVVGSWEVIAQDNEELKLEDKFRLPHLCQLDVLRILFRLNAVGLLNQSILALKDVESILEKQRSEASSARVFRRHSSKRQDSPEARASPRNKEEKNPLDITITPKRLITILREHKIVQGADKQLTVSSGFSKWYYSTLLTLLWKREKKTRLSRAKRLFSRLHTQRAFRPLR